MQYITPIKPTRATDEPDPANAENVPVNTIPCYDIAGNLLYQHSMDGGDRWMLTDAAGQPLLGWDFNDRAGDDVRRLHLSRYDDLHRPTEQWLRLDDAAPLMVELIEYRDTESDPEAHTRNLVGHKARHYDPSGPSEVLRADLKGAVQEEQRRLNNRPRESLIDWQHGPDGLLESETFTRVTEHDALGRMARLYNWHRSQTRVAVYEPSYSERGLLEAEDLIVGAQREGGSHSGGRRTAAVHGIAYDAKGQRQCMRCGDAGGTGTETLYSYDRFTFRLTSLHTTRPLLDSEVREVVQALVLHLRRCGEYHRNSRWGVRPGFFQEPKVDPRNLYRYDALHRLVEASGRENYSAPGLPGQLAGEPPGVRFPVIVDNALRQYTQSYSYDSVGNFVAMQNSALDNSWTRYYGTAEDSNRLLRTWEGDPSWVSDRATNKIEYGYDTHGSMQNLGNVAPGQFSRWDYRDMIHSLDLVGGGWAYYNYDAGKQRTRKRIERVGGTVEERLYLGGIEVYRSFGAGEPIEVVEEIETHHLFIDDQRVLMVEDVLETNSPDLTAGTLYRYQYGNHLGSVALAVC